MKQSVEREIRVELIPAPSIFVTGHGKSVSPMGLGKVMLFLVFLQGASITRADMARLLWPGEGEDVAANRLRVSLNRVKALVGNALIANRRIVRLAGIGVTVDLWDYETSLIEALDEVDPEHQMVMLSALEGAIRSAHWRSFTELDPAGSLKRWDETCRKSLRRMAEIATKNRDWDSVDLVWQLMRDRGDLDVLLSERYLDAHHARGSLADALQAVRGAAAALGIEPEGEPLRALRTYGQTLQASGAPSTGLQTSHAQLLGSALLSQVGQHAEALAHLLVTEEVRLQMQSAPAEQVQILDEVQACLPNDHAAWAELEYTRLNAYHTLYNANKVIEISESLLKRELPPNRAAGAWGYYSFSLFIHRRWDEAMHACREALRYSELEDADNLRESFLLMEGAYLWHLGEVEEARRIYDSFLERYADTTDLVLGVTHAITHGNYAIIELVFGEISEARRRIDLAYAERKRFNLTRHMPVILSVMGVVYGRTGEVARGIEFAIESLKLTYGRGSTREGQLNMEWACGLLVLGGLRAEARAVMDWVNAWRIQTKHTRSVCEEKFYGSLELQEFDSAPPMLTEGADYRQVMGFLIKCLRRVQKNIAPLGE
jgi:tetratricopeptide (TPR) repeat protein